MTLHTICSQVPLDGIEQRLVENGSRNKRTPPAAATI
jgi:hypothetical protein